MAYHYRLSELATLPVAERQRALERLVESAKSGRNGQASLLNERIRRFELRYEMHSDDLRAKLRAGELSETAEIAQWLFLLAARENLATSAK